MSERVLELALKMMSLELDALVKECVDGKDIKAPSRKAFMRARGMLPPYCEMAFKKD
jgi:hypothetical protein